MKIILFSREINFSKIADRPWVRQTGKLGERKNPMYSPGFR
jgi:hypothetical protein